MDEPLNQDYSIASVSTQSRAMKRSRYTSEPGSEPGSKPGSKPGSSVSSVSFVSDSSRGQPPLFSNTSTELIKDMKRMKMWSGASTQSRGQPPVFSPESPEEDEYPTTSTRNKERDTLKVFELKSMALLKQALASHKRVISAKNRGILNQFLEEEQVGDAEAREAALKIALHVLRTMKEDEHALTLEQNHYGVLELFQRHLKTLLKKKNQCLIEEQMTQDWPVPFTKIYTKVYLRDGNCGDVNSEHEVRQIELAFNKRKTPESPSVDIRDIFKAFPNRAASIRTVLTTGIAGIGKTVLVQKLILDWAEGRANQDFQLLFPLSFRELNLLKNQTKSLMELLYDFSPGLRDSGLTDLTQYKVLMVLDGLDESRLQLDFSRNYSCSDETRSMSVDALLTNLMMGNLLPNATLWITSRPAAAGRIPPQFIDRVTEIRGFNNLQKEAYFLKKIDDEKLARRVVANVRSAPSLYIMCHLPVFCWISSIVLRKMCTDPGSGKMPKTLTQMYIHFLAHQMMQMQRKYRKEQELDSKGNNKIILSLGKLAFEQLEKGNLIFYEEDLKECGTDVREATVYSGVCTQVFREETWREHKVFCFVHLSVQEFLAALYVLVVFNVDGVNLMVRKQKQRSRNLQLFNLHKAAVDEALRNRGGHFDLFLRFLLGLSLESSQTLLKGLNVQVKACDAENHKETVDYVTEKISQTPAPQRSMNLFHCLNEFNHRSLLQQVQIRLDSDQDSVMDQSSPAQWAALNFLLLTSPEKPEEIHLKRFCGSEEGLQRLVPAITASRSAALNDCSLSISSCQVLSSTLSSVFNELLHLNLSDNLLQDSGLELLCVGLQSPHCRLRTLRLNRCGLTRGCCDKLASVLVSSGLKELDLSDNDVEDSGLEKLCSGLRDQRCRLETLRLSFCDLTVKSCQILSAAVKSNPSYLKELDLSYNHLTETGAELLSEALDEAHCELIKLRVDHNAEHWFKPGLRQYACELSVDINTAHKQLLFSDDKREIRQGLEDQPYPDHPDRFMYWAQVLLRPALKSRCYWEVDWSGNWAGIGVAYKSIGRKGADNGCVMGYNEASWSLHCSAHGYRAYHNYRSVEVPVPLDVSRRLAVYLDWTAGVLSFYRVSGKSLTHLHTFNAKFTKPLFPIFRVWGPDSVLRLCEVKRD